jgi:predicted O-methyltransferase YrrM
VNVSGQLEVTAAINRYIREHLAPEPEDLRALREETAKLPNARMQISPEQGRFMSIVLRAMGARQTIEVGVFTGYSTLVTALALPAGGRVVACDISDEWTRIARRYWRQSGVDDRIDLRLAPAADTLDTLISEGERGRYDFAFIDADKGNYDAYYERCLTLVRAGGLIMIDNSLWGGAVTDPGAGDADTTAIRELNAKIARDARVEAYLAPIGDGVHMALKRGS